MKKMILRILISAILFSLISGIVVTILGLVLRWKTSTQFSDGFFWAGAILISIGLLFVVGSQNERTVSGLQYNWSAVKMDLAERFKLWETDLSSGYSKLAFFGISGLLLFGQSALALLFGRLF
jgi:hypothetical protein